MRISSPVTGTTNVRKVCDYDVTTITELYRQQENVDVAPYFKGLDQIQLFECQDTGYRFYHPFETAGGPEFYGLLAAENEKRGLEYDRDWDEDHQFGFAHASEGDSILEIGCNTGKFLKRLSNKTPNVIGLDFSPDAVAKARQRGVRVVNETIAEHASKNPGAYDLICAFQVFEHLSQPGEAMAAMIKALKPGGKIVLSVPNNEPFFQRFSKYEVLNMPPHHVGLWNLSAFRRLAGHFKLHLVDHLYYGTRGLLADAYLRTRFISNVRSLPVRHTASDKMRMLVFAPFALGMSTYDFAVKGARNHGNLCVVFRKDQQP